MKVPITGSDVLHSSRDSKIPSRPWIGLYRMRFSYTTFGKQSHRCYSYNSSIRLTSLKPLKRPTTPEADLVEST